MATPLDLMAAALTPLDRARTAVTAALVGEDDLRPEQVATRCVEAAAAADEAAGLLFEAARAAGASDAAPRPRPEGA